MKSCTWIDTGLGDSYGVGHLLHAFNDIVINRVFPSLLGNEHDIMSTVPLRHQRWIFLIYERDFRWRLGIFLDKPKDLSLPRSGPGGGAAQTYLHLMILYCCSQNDLNQLLEKRQN